MLPGPGLGLASVLGEGGWAFSLTLSSSIGTPTGCSTMFKKLTKRILKLVDDDGELQSFASVTESRGVDMLSIVKIVKSNNWFNFKKKRYHYTGVKLQELLQGQDTVDFGE
ncbi:hypothetical protein SKAU_G00139440 [Synaphobranchus kaupii]|uniref:Gasdermin pore forming domain-containing protein n=1 Tax=Synaphobranchus kaupii TaxID=118154 RepID=A0A9Q1FS46_SYNKA|nr:hypothetical protein SKAU_G00139440 [Synaphobranchus kaupii]